MIPHDKDYSIRGNVILPLKNIDHPLNKIFGGIPAGSSDIPHDSVRHYRKFYPRYLSIIIH